MAHRPSSQSSPNLRAYFRPYTGFVYKPTQPATKEFRRLRDSLNKKGQDPNQADGQAFANALRNQFQEKYGSELSDLVAWQKLCLRIGIDPVPDTLEDARNAVWGMHFNIIDIIDDGPDGSLPTFPTKQALRVYTTKAKKNLPAQSMKGNAILASLLNGRASAVSTSADIDPIIESLGTALASTHIESRQETVSGGMSRAPFAEPSSDDDDENMLPLNAFFVQFPNFHYEPSRPSKSEFRRLCKTMGWKKKDAAKASAYVEFSEAMAAQFGRKFGVDMNDLVAWQRLCARLEIDPIPDELEEAREVVFNTYANLVDLVDEGEVVKFPTEMDLSDYTNREKKRFPMGGLRAGDILNSLLRYIDFPPPVGSRRTSLGVLVRA